MASTQPSSAPVSDIQKHTQTGQQKRRRLFVILLFLAVIALLVGWQIVSTGSNTTDPTVAGRPLSNPQMHLHTIAPGEKPGTFYLGTHYGIFISTDNGHTWPQKRGILSTLMVTTIVTNSRLANSLALVGIPSTTGGSPAGAYFSQDGGTTWTLRNPPGISKTASPYTIEAGSSNNQHFYVFYLYAGWFETQDMGKHWRPFAQGTLSTMQTPSLLTFAGNPNHLLLGGDQGLFESKDDGQSWSALPSVQGYVYALIASETTSATIFCATEQGLYTWKNGTTQIRQVVLPGNSIFSRITTDASGQIVYGLAGRDLWYSQDSGTTWTVRKHFDRGDFTALLIDPLHASKIYVSFFLPAQVVYSTDNGKSWNILTDSTTP